MTRHRQGEIQDEEGELVATAPKTGSLYYLNCEPLTNQQIHATIAKENLWHRRFGHLGERGLCQLVKEDLVNGFDYDVSKEIEFCEACVSGKIHRKPFSGTGRERAKEPLGIIHSDVCGKNQLTITWQCRVLCDLH